MRLYIAIRGIGRARFEEGCEGMPDICDNGSYLYLILLFSWLAGVCNTSATHGHTLDDTELLLYHTWPAAGHGHTSVSQQHPTVLTWTSSTFFLHSIIVFIQSPDATTQVSALHLLWTTKNRELLITLALLTVYGLLRQQCSSFNIIWFKVTKFTNKIYVFLQGKFPHSCGLGKDG